jgi:flagellar basal body rod protein FlgB
MSARERKRLGKLHAQGKTPHYKMHYLEFKEEIDRELSGGKEEPKKKGGK